MLVRCVGNLGIHVAKKDFVAGQIFPQTHFELVIGVVYSCYAISIYDGHISFLVEESDNHPFWCPQSLFEVIDSKLPESWNVFIVKDSRLQMIVGYAAMGEPDHYDGLQEREPKDMAIFRRMKRELLLKSQKSDDVD